MVLLKGHEEEFTTMAKANYQLSISKRTAVISLNS
jgi:hypothetical protein